MESVKYEACDQTCGGSMQQNFPPAPHALQQMMRNSQPSYARLSVRPQEPPITNEADSTSPTSLDTGAIIIAVLTALCCCLPIGIASIVVSGFAYEKRGEAKHDCANLLTKISLVLSVCGILIGTTVTVVVIVYTNNIYTGSEDM